MAQNDYDEYDDRYDDEEYEEMDRREFRRRRRKRNHTIAVIVSIVLLLAIAAGIFFGVTALIDKFNLNQPAQEMQLQSDENADEEPVVIEAPMEQ